MTKQNKLFDISAKMIGEKIQIRVSKNKNNHYFIFQITEQNDDDLYDYDEELKFLNVKEHNILSKELTLLRSMSLDLNKKRCVKNNDTHKIIFHKSYVTLLDENLNIMKYYYKNEIELKNLNSIDVYCKKLKYEVYEEHIKKKYFFR